MEPDSGARMPGACDWSKFTAAFEPFYAVTWGTPKHAPPRSDKRVVYSDREYVFFFLKSAQIPLFDGTMAELLKASKPLKTENHFTQIT
jgi:hypothetical protein